MGGIDWLTGPEHQTLREVLLRAEEGWQLYPIYGVDADGVCACPNGATCPDPGKHPTTPHGFSDASSDPERIAEMFARWSGDNVGHKTGKGSGTVIIDVDPRNGGMETLGLMPPNSIMGAIEQLAASGFITIEVEEATSYRITAKGVDEVEGNRPQSQQNVSNVFNMPNSTFIHSAVGNDNTNTFSGDLDFSTVERRIDEEGGADKEVLRQLVAEMREMLESGETLEKGRLARFNDKLKEPPWLAGPVAGWLLNFGTQEIGQYLS
jgi:DNA-binding PadR family transcriptional regulator